MRSHHDHKHAITYKHIVTHITAARLQLPPVIWLLFYRLLEPGERCACRVIVRLLAQQGLNASAAWPRCECWNCFTGVTGGGMPWPAGLRLRGRTRGGGVVYADTADGGVLLNGQFYRTLRSAQEAALRSLGRNAPGRPVLSFWEVELPGGSGSPRWRTLASFLSPWYKRQSRR